MNQQIKSLLVKIDDVCEEIEQAITHSAEMIQSTIHLLTLIEESIKTNSDIVSMLAASLNVTYKD